MGNLAQGTNVQISGAIEASGVEDWVTFNFTQGSSLHLTLRNASPDARWGRDELDAMVTFMGQVK
jgi:hypothetical protein